MSKMLVPNDGVRGIDIQTEKGKTSYDANRAGVIEVNNPAHAKSLRAQGFTDAGVSFSVSNVGATDSCECGEVKFTYQTLCAKCYVASQE